MDFFFYGTLMDAQVRRLVLGPGAEALALEPARLSGYRRLAKLKSSAPVLVPHRGARVEGLLARGLDRRQAARICHFEGRNYRLFTCAVRLQRGERVRAGVFLGRGRNPVKRAPWRLAAWQRRDKRAFLKLIALWMAGYRVARSRARGRVH